MVGNAVRRKSADQPVEPALWERSVGRGTRVHPLLPLPLLPLLPLRRDQPWGRCSWGRSSGTMAPSTGQTCWQMPQSMQMSKAIQ